MSARAEVLRAPSRSRMRVVLSSVSPENAIAVIALAGIFTHLVMRYPLHAPRSAYLLPLYVVLLFGGVPLVAKLARKLWEREFGSDLLAGVSIATAAVLGEYLVGAIVVLMLSGGEALEQFATRRASSILEALAKRMPSIAHEMRDGHVVDIPLNEITIGSSLRVFPHELCPVDGNVTEGHGWMDESYLTGEPYRISKAPGAQVLSGAINGDTVLTIEAAKLPVDSRYARIMRVMREAEARRPRLRRLGDQLGAWYTPAALALGVIGWIAAGSAERFLSVVVIATPCPLLLAIPTAIIGAISLAARHAVVIKNPAMLERIDSCRTVILDKTGTLTYGTPSLTEAVCEPAFTADEILRLVASLEQYSKHPLAGAVLNAAKDRSLAFASVSHVSEEPGAGIRGIVEGRSVEVVGRQTLAAPNTALPAALAVSSTGLESLVFIDGAFAALLRFRDEPREDSLPFVRHLPVRHGVRHVMVLSGDRETEVRYLARRVGIAEMYYGKSPEEKVAIVRDQTRRSPTLFVGDGINDAPAMQAATVGLALGQNSDITSAAADAVVMEPSLGKIDEVIHIGRRMRSIALQSALGGMALSIVGMLVALAGYLPPVAGAVAQEIIDIAAVLNAVRVAFPIGDLKDF